MTEPYEKINTYYAWLFAASDEFAEALVAKMIRRGFTIGPLGRQLITKMDDNPAVAIAMSIYRKPKDMEERTDYNALGIHNEIASVVKNVKGKFWGIVVSQSSDCTWNVGNISLAAEAAAFEQDLKKVN